MFHIFNTCLKPFNFSFFFSGGINIFSKFLEFLSVTGFGFTILSTNLFPINAPVASAALSTIFLEAVFRTYSPVFATVSNNSVLYLSDGFLANDKNSYHLTYFLVLGSTEERVNSIY